MATERESAIVVELSELDAVLDDPTNPSTPPGRWGMSAHLTLLYPFVLLVAVDHTTVSTLEAVAKRVSPFDSSPHAQRCRHERDAGRDGP